MCWFSTETPPSLRATCPAAGVTPTAQVGAFARLMFPVVLFAVAVAPAEAHDVEAEAELRVVVVSGDLLARGRGGCSHVLQAQTQSLVALAGGCVEVEVIHLGAVT